MSEVIEGIGAAQRERIAALRSSGGFFWIDVPLGETSGAEVGEALDIPSHALEPLLNFSADDPPSRKFHADGQHVVFPFSCFLESSERADGGEHTLRPIEVHVLVSGDYLLTVHAEGPSLAQVLSHDTPEGRSEQYVVYAILDAIVASSYDALNEAELTLEGLQLVSTNLRASRVRLATLREINSRLSQMRRRLGPQRGIFERISVEIGRVEGLEADSQQYFERIYAQLNRLIDGIDATGDAMAKLIDLRLNETIYWLTVVATVFLPLTFVTGFFGMNFTWMVEQIDTPLAFVLLGIGTPALGVALTLLLVRRRGTPVEPDHNSAAIASSGSDVSIPA
jgi:magnesium transporter